MKSAIRLGHLSKEILSVAEELGADLIVVEARGETHAELFPIGAVARKVVKYASCSVLIVR